ncbi:hypothetical protein NDU88_003764 [Pleurodeles waltl]|uniref:Uncharacterized protein n=1 Tax=Pleurodeles waltl TaxID=8319 RepID=A0AAV7SGW8_PLEWA|nr:hypothetical protein NDU88_003764 [Pleurodeles waltl]
MGSEGAELPECSDGKQTGPDGVTRRGWKRKEHSKGKKEKTIQYSGTIPGAQALGVQKKERTQALGLNEEDAGARSLEAGKGSQGTGAQGTGARAVTLEAVRRTTTDLHKPRNALSAHRALRKQSAIPALKYKPARSALISQGMLLGQPTKPTKAVTRWQEESCGRHEPSDKGKNCLKNNVKGPYLMLE